MRQVSSRTHLGADRRTVPFSDTATLRGKDREGRHGPVLYTRAAFGMKPLRRALRLLRRRGAPPGTC